MKKLLLLLLTACVLGGVTLADAVTIKLKDKKNSTYTIETVEPGLKASSGFQNTWTYRITEVSGKDLGHWGLTILPDMLFSSNLFDHIVSVSPNGAKIGKDGSTGKTGIKWEVDDDFTSGEFSFTLDDSFSYAPGRIQAYFKAGPTWKVVDIDGPIRLSGQQPAPTQHAPEPSTLLLLGTGLIAAAGVGKKAIKAARRASVDS